MGTLPLLEAGKEEQPRAQARQTSGNDHGQNDVPALLHAAVPGGALVEAGRPLRRTRILRKGERNNAAADSIYLDVCLGADAGGPDDHGGGGGAQQVQGGSGQGLVVRYAGVLISGVLGGLGGIVYITTGVSEWKFEYGVAGLGLPAPILLIIRFFNRQHLNG